MFIIKLWKLEFIDLTVAKRWNSKLFNLSGGEWWNFQSIGLTIVELGEFEYINVAFDEWNFKFMNLTHWFLICSCGSRILWRDQRCVAKSIFRCRSLTISLVSDRVPTRVLRMCKPLLV